ncbi:MAG: MFS transporter [Desulfocapsaceae bacterium]|jgi:NNP family nitrate/nitrite transporter-like MFS transporter|nr:MFS transporter [Desulfocapsaceae bacterium]
MNVKQEGGTAPIKNRPVLMIFMLVVAVFFSMASRAIFSPLMPSLQNEMGVTLSLAGTLFLLISSSYAAAMMFSGFLAARIGHGMTIVAAMACISLGLLVSAAAPGIMILALGMLFIGAGAGTYPPSGMVMINTKISVRRRSTALSFHEIGPNLALLLSPLIVLILEPWFGWRGVLLWMALVCGFATVAFWRWGTADSGIGAAPDFGTIKTILCLRSTWVGMVILSAVLSALHGVYAILPAYLVSEYSLSPQYVNFLLTVSRIAGVLLLLRADWIIQRFGNRKTIISVLIFSSFFTALIGLARGNWISIVVIAQPALITVMIPALLSSLADIGEARYQNITYALIITAGVTLGAGLAPALLGLCGDLGVGWLGFLGLAAYMVAAIVFTTITPAFGKD